jgi:hypothetical protein
MSTPATLIENALVLGDLAQLSTEQRVVYYNRLCEGLGLNAMTKPFAYITLSGKLTLYATKDCTEQLRKLHGVSVTSCVGQLVDGVYVVTATGKDRQGREDSATGAVPIEGLKGEAKANALMKAETKAKRRLTLSVCGLGILDESETDSIPGAQKAPQEAQAAVRPALLPPAPPVVIDQPTAPPAPENTTENVVPEFGEGLPDVATPLEATAESLEHGLRACADQRGARTLWALWKSLEPTAGVKAQGLAMYTRALRSLPEA